MKVSKSLELHITLFGPFAQTGSERNTSRSFSTKLRACKGQDNLKSGFFSNKVCEGAVIKFKMER